MGSACTVVYFRYMCVFCTVYVRLRLAVFPAGGPFFGLPLYDMFQPEYTGVLSMRVG
jgi:hypothetical protein